MKRLLLLSAISLAACAASPTAPSPSSVPATHNVRATAPDGTVWFVCATQPRGYSTGPEVDHYLQRTECPRTPID